MAIVAAVGSAPKAQNHAALAQKEEEGKQMMKDSRKHAIAGGLSGIASRLIVSPLDVIKIRFQLEMHWPHSTGERAYKSVWQSARKIVAEEGSRGLWKGTVPSLGLWFIYSGVQFPVYNLCKVKLGNESELLGRFGLGSASFSFVAGAVGAFAGTLISYPLDTIRTQWVFQGLPQNMTLPSLTVHILKQDGLIGFYRGFFPALVQVVPSMAFSFLFYDVFKRAALGSRQNGTLQPLENLLVGGAAGVLSKLIVYPLDTAKKRLQVNKMIGIRPLEERYHGLVDCMIKMAREEGVRSLFKGTAPTLLKSGISSALTFTSFEISARTLSSKGSNGGSALR